MRKCIILLLFGLPIFLCANQLSYQFANSDIEGFQQRFFSYFSLDKGNFLIQNTTSLSLFEKSDDFSFFYQRNLIKNRFQLHYTREHISLSPYLYYEHQFDDNLPRQNTGVEGFYKSNYSLHPGFSGFVSFSSMRTEFNLNYSYQDMEKVSISQERDHNQENESIENDATEEANLYFTIKTIFNQEGTIKPYLTYKHFDDLNENSILDYHDTNFGLLYDNQLTYVHYLKQSIDIGYNDVYPDIPFYGHLKTRFTSKIAHNWMFVNRLDITLWSSDDWNDFFYGNDFLESVIQYNLFHSPRNHLTQIQAGITYYPSESRSIMKLNGQYFFRMFTFFAQFKHYINSLQLKNFIEGKISVDLIQSNLKIGFVYSIKQFQILESEQTQLIQVDYSF